MDMLESYEEAFIRDGMPDRFGLDPGAKPVFYIPEPQRDTAAYRLNTAKVIGMMK